MNESVFTWREAYLQTSSASVLLDFKYFSGGANQGQLEYSLGDKRKRALPRSWQGPLSLEVGLTIS